MEGQTTRMIRRYFPRLGENWQTQFDPKFFTIYLDGMSVIAVGWMLRLRAVGDGNSNNGDRADFVPGTITDITIL